MVEEATKGKESHLLNFSDFLLQKLYSWKGLLRGAMAAPLFSPPMLKGVVTCIGPLQTFSTMIKTKSRIIISICTKSSKKECFNKETE